MKMKSEIPEFLCLPKTGRARLYPPEADAMGIEIQIFLNCKISILNHS
jgi:hypothetical protein